VSAGRGRYNGGDHDGAMAIMTAATIEETVRLCNDSHYQLKGIASFSSHRFAL